MENDNLITIPKTEKDDRFFKVEVKVSNKSPHPSPSYKIDGDSGFDLRAWLSSPLTLNPLERALVRTGLYFELPKSCEIQVRPRSGNALKLGLGVLNSPGTVDSNYRGEVCVIAVNLSNEKITICDGDRIAQGVVCPVYNSYYVELKAIDEVSKDTDRGSGGFGHTGTR